MNGCRRVHKLRTMVNNKDNIRVCDGDILNSTNGHAIKGSVVHGVTNMFEKWSSYSRRLTRLGIMHISTKKIKDIVGLSEQKTIRSGRYFNIKEVVKKIKVFDGKLGLKGSNNFR
jgi:hypothetical protein